MIAELRNINKYYGAEQILSDVSLKIEDKDRIGLIGANGAGKTTLLNIITGELSCDEGEIIRSSKSIGYLKQNTGLTGKNTVIEEMRSVFSHLIETGKRLDEIYRRMSEMQDHSSKEYFELERSYSALQTEYEQKDGYNIDVKINSILNGMGFLNKDRSTVIDTLSGGEKTRLAICKLLISEPELLILDEPTNHLDFKTLSWLEEYLASYKGALLMVSHDRYFLDKSVGITAEIYKGRLKVYKGNYTKFRELKQAELKHLTKEYEKQQNEIASLKTYVEKNLVRASTTKMAQSRQKALDRMEIIDKPSDYLKTISLSFEYDTEPVFDILNVSGLNLEIGGKLLASNLNLDVKRGEKIAIVGENGIGKTTFIKELMNRNCAEISWGRNTKRAYFEQETSMLNENNTVIGEISDSFPTLYEQEIRNVLGRMRLTGDDVFKRIRNLSGGEKAKVKFAKMILRRGNVLILDEPTNHLDLSSKDNLDDALFKYTGTIIMVSHDRYLLNKVPTKIIELRSDGLFVYEGKYDDYLRKKEEDHSNTEAAPRQEKKETSNNYFRSKKDRAEEVKRKKMITGLENKISAFESEIEKLNEELSSPEVCSDFAILNEKCVRIDSLKSELEKLYEEWENWN